MHTTLLVTVSKIRAKTNLAARRAVVEHLAKDGEFFAKDEVGNSVGIADWFVVGGRASGTLAELSRAGKKDEGLGSESDAALVTDKLYEEALREFEGQSKALPNALIFWDVDGDRVTKKDFVGKKWLVVVDYHS